MPCCAGTEPPWSYSSGFFDKRSLETAGLGDGSKSVFCRDTGRYCLKLRVFAAPANVGIQSDRTHEHPLS